METENGVKTGKKRPFGVYFGENLFWNAQERLFFVHRLEVSTTFGGKMGLF